MSTTRPKRDSGGYLSLDGVGKEVLKERPEDSELGILRELGRDLVNYFFMSLRTLAIHSEENDAVELPLEKLVSILEALTKAVHRTHFITVEGQIYLNDLRIKMEAAAYGNVQYLVGILDRHEIGGITFSRALSREELKKLLLLLLNTRVPRGPDVDALSHIRERLSEAEIPGVDLDRPYFFKAAEAHTMSMASGDAAAEQETAAVAYAKGILAVKDYFRAVEAAETANPLRIRKIVHDLVDVAEEDPEDFLKLHTIHGVEDTYYNHCVNVSVLSVSIGLRLQLSRLELADLGAAAMFHDLGYSGLKHRAEEEQEEFGENETRKWHPIEGFRTLLGQGEYGPGLLRRMLVMLEHHMHYQRPGGFPNLGKKRLSVYTRIIQVADHYDALVCPSADGEPGLLPLKALERIIAVSGRVFDPLVVKTLVNVVGRYPYGSLVVLSSDEVGVVTCGGRNEDSFLTPRVMVVRNADGSECEPREVDLAKDRAMKRRVRSVLDPYQEALTPHTYLFDKLGTERVFEEQEAGMDADAWTRAIWSGQSTEEILKDKLGDTESSEGAPPEETAAPVEVAQQASLSESEVEPAPATVPGDAPTAWSASLEDSPEPWEQEAGSAPPVVASGDDFLDGPEPWELGEGGAESGPADDPAETGTAPPDPEAMTAGEVAACKAAQQEAVLQAFSEGGEAAVAAVAGKHWSEFWTPSS